MNHLLIPEITSDIKFRFWQYVNKSDFEGCWLWVGSCIGKDSKNPKPSFRIGEKHYIATRISWYLHNNTDPGEYQICHNCHPNPDNKICVQPKHLWLGTQSENSKDYYNKGGIPSYGNTRLTKEDILSIRELYKTMQVNDLAKQFNIRREYVWRIVNYKTWKNI